MTSRAFLLLFLLSTAAFAQVSDTVTVEVVQVPVYVTRNGAPVPGLNRDNFELLVDGRRTAIEYFDVLDYREDVKDPVVELRERRLFLLLFDQVSSSQWSRRRAREAAANLIKDSRTSPNDAFAVATFSDAKGIHFLVPFTRDRAAVLRAVQTLRAATGDAFALIPPPDDGMGGIDFSTFPDDANEQTLAAMSEEIALRMQWHLLDSLAALAERLRPLQGDKHVILFSEGYDFGQQKLATGGGRTGKNDLTNYRRAEHMFGKFRASGVILDAIDIKGLREATDTSPYNSLFAMALSTGGTVQHQQNDLTAALRTLRDMQNVTYLLGFKPARGRGDGKIEVKVRGAGENVAVRHRTGFSRTPAKANPSDGLYMADVLLNDIPQHGIGVDLVIEPGTGGAGVSASISGSDLLVHLGQKSGKAELFFYVFDANNLVAGWSVKKLTIDPAKARAQLASSPLKIAEAFKLAPGRYVAKVLFRLTGDAAAAGFERAEFEVR